MKFNGRVSASPWEVISCTMSFKPCFLEPFVGISFGQVAQSFEETRSDLESTKRI